MENTTYDINYFLSNEYFVRWVKNPQPETHSFWDKWLKNHPESQESFNRAKAIVEQIDFRTDTSIGIRKEEVLDLVLKDQVSSLYVQKRKIPKIVSITLRFVAACVLFGIVSSIFYLYWPTVAPVATEQQPSYITKNNPKGQKIGFYLPDKSWVILNSDSKIRYPERFEGDSREVFLEGEAYFDVFHDSLKTFLVHSGEMVTQVHGTSFNVQAYPGENYSVALERGAVSISFRQELKTGETHFLKPGEMIEITSDFAQSRKRGFDPDLQFGWKEGKLVFKQANVQELVTRLERWYNVQIAVHGHSISNWSVSGSFQNESLENVLESIKYTRDIAYEINGNQVTIHLKPEFD